MDTVNVFGDTSTQVETASTQTGQMLAAGQMTSMPLNGRGYTKLLVLGTQPSDDERIIFGG